MPFWKGEGPSQKVERTKRTHWLGRKHSPESKLLMRAARLASWKAGKHESIRKPPPEDREVACRRCGGAFKVRSRGRIMAMKYCSTECQRLSLKDEAAKARSDRRKPCPGCGVVFGAKWMGRKYQQYCTHACMRAKKQRDKAPVIVPCVVCGKLVPKRKADIKRTASSSCSNECRRKYGRGVTSPLYRGDVEHFRGANWRVIAEAARVRDGRACRRCHVQQPPKGRRFPVDHIRPWRSFLDEDEANHPDNLATLCHTCHTIKTMTIERAWLRGDMMPFQQFLKDIQPVQPSLA